MRYTREKLRVSGGIIEEETSLRDGQVDRLAIESIEGAVILIAVDLMRSMVELIRGEFARAFGWLIHFIRLLGFAPVEVPSFLAIRTL